jgi:hypothetical protein
VNPKTPSSTWQSSSGQPAFRWVDHSRFVEVQPVRTGWLVLWGRYEDAGRRKVLLGNQTYRSLDGVRQRLANAVLDLTGKRMLAQEAVAIFERFPIPPHQPAELPEPL